MKYKLALLLILIFTINSVVFADENVILEDVDSIKANISERVTIISEVVHLTQINFVASEDIDETQLRITRLNDKPSRAPAPLYNIYEYFGIDAGHLEQYSNITSANLTFYVPVRWLDGLFIDESRVMLLRFADDGWEELETKLLGKTSVLYNYNAKTSGFGFFAIAGERNTREAEEPAEITSASVVEAEPAETEEETEEEITSGAVESSSTFAEQKSSNLIYLLLGVIIVLLTVICYLLFSIKKKQVKVSRKKPETRRKRR